MKKISNKEYKIIPIGNYNKILEVLNYYNEYFPISLLEMVNNLEEYAKKLNEKANTMQIVDSNNQQLGIVIFYSNDTINYVGFLTLIAVNKNYNNMGIGSKLLEYFEQYCKSCGMKKTRLEVLKENEKAIHFYKRHNYNFVSEDNNSYYMEKSI